MRTIPVTMATQHPDNAFPAFFNKKRYISTQDEIEECYRCFSDLKVHEYMWDWEGKYVDEAVIDRLFSVYNKYFNENQLGRDKFLTFRLPNIWLESSFKLPRAFINVITAAEIAKKFKFHSPPLFEMILPMTSSVSQLQYLHKTFRKIARASKTIFNIKSDIPQIDVIPLIEEFDLLLDPRDFLKKYISFLSKMLGKKPKYLRVFIARSDPALNAGLLPAKLAAKVAMAHIHEVGKQKGIRMYPWLGGGALPFRGSINPNHPRQVINDYKGYASLTIQSSFRYDYPLEKVKRAIKMFNDELPQNLDKYEKISENELKVIQHIHKIATASYQKIIEEIAPLLNKIAEQFPSHRERILHIGMLGYGRGVGKVKLPRAIKFTGVLYSLGIPPEVITTGRIISWAVKKGYIGLIERLCPNLKAELLRAGRLLNKDNLNHLSKKNAVWSGVKNDVKLIEKYLNCELHPVDLSEKLNTNYTSIIFHKFQAAKNIQEDILTAAELRRSLG